jgi:hypothetical protein
MEGPAEKYIERLKCEFNSLRSAPMRARDKEYRSAWRQWYLSGRRPKDKPNLPPRLNYFESYYRDGCAALDKEQYQLKTAYLATPEGRAEVADSLLQEAAAQEWRFRTLLDEPYRFHLLTLSPDVERLARQQHSYWRHLLSGYEFGGPDEILRRKKEDDERGEWHGMRGFTGEEGEYKVWSKPTRAGGKGKYEGTESYSPFPSWVIKVMSTEQGLLWKAQTEGYMIPYLEYVALCESADQEPPNRKEYMKLQRPHRKAAV